MSAAPSLDRRKTVLQWLTANLVLSIDVRMRHSVEDLVDGIIQKHPSLTGTFAESHSIIKEDGIAEELLLTTSATHLLDMPPARRPLLRINNTLTANIVSNEEREAAREFLYDNAEIFTKFYPCEDMRSVATDLYRDSKVHPSTCSWWEESKLQVILEILAVPWDLLCVDLSRPLYWARHLHGYRLQKRGLYQRSSYEHLLEPYAVPGTIKVTKCIFRGNGMYQSTDNPHEYTCVPYEDNECERGLLYVDKVHGHWVLEVRHNIVEILRWTHFKAPRGQLWPGLWHFAPALSITENTLFDEVPPCHVQVIHTPDTFNQRQIAKTFVNALVARHRSRSKGRPGFMNLVESARLERPALYEHNAWLSIEGLKVLIHDRLKPLTFVRSQVYTPAPTEAEVAAVGDILFDVIDEIPQNARHSVSSFVAYCYGHFGTQASLERRLLPPTIPNKHRRLFDDTFLLSWLLKPGLMLPMRGNMEHKSPLRWHHRPLNILARNESYKRQSALLTEDAAFTSFVFPVERQTPEKEAEPLLSVNVTTPHILLSDLVVGACADILFDAIANLIDSQSATISFMSCFYKQNWSTLTEKCEDGRPLHLLEMKPIVANTKIMNQILKSGAFIIDSSPTYHLGEQAKKPLRQEETILKRDQGYWTRRMQTSLFNDAVFKTIESIPSSVRDKDIDFLARYFIKNKELIAASMTDKFLTRDQFYHLFPDANLTYILFENAYTLYPNRGRDKPLATKQLWLSTTRGHVWGMSRNDTWFLTTHQRSLIQSVLRHVIEDIPQDARLKLSSLALFCRDNFGSRSIRDLPLVPVPEVLIPRSKTDLFDLFDDVRRLGWILSRYMVASASEKGSPKPLIWKHDAESNLYIGLNEV